MSGTVTLQPASYGTPCHNSVSSEIKLLDNIARGKLCTVRALQTSAGHEVADEEVVAAAMPRGRIRRQVVHENNVIVAFQQPVAPPLQETSYSAGQGKIAVQE